MLKSWHSLGAAARRAGAAASALERRKPRERGHLGGQVVRFRLQEPRDTAAEAFVCDVMCAEGGNRQVSALDLVLALGAGLDARQFVRDRVVDGLVIAKLEMQERVFFGGAPIAAVKRAAPQQIERAGDGLAVPLRAEEDDALRHCRA